MLPCVRQVLEACGRRATCDLILRFKIWMVQLYPYIHEALCIFVEGWAKHCLKNVMVSFFFLGVCLLTGLLGIMQPKTLVSDPYYVREWHNPRKQTFLVNHPCVMNLSWKCIRHHLCHRWVRVTHDRWLMEWPTFERPNSYSLTHTPILGKIRFVEKTCNRKLRPCLEYFRRAHKFLAISLHPTPFMIDYDTNLRLIHIIYTNECCNLVLILGVGTESWQVLQEAPLNPCWTMRNAPQYMKKGQEQPNTTIVYEPFFATLYKNHDQRFFLPEQS